MNKKLFLLGMFGVVLVFGIYAQSTNNEPRLVGRWQNVGNGEIWIFFPTGEGFNSSTRSGNGFRFGAHDGRMIIIHDGSYGIGCDYIFYNDGKMLMLFTEAYGANSVLLQKIPDENSVE